MTPYRTARREARVAYRKVAANEPRLLMPAWVVAQVGEDFPAYGTVTRALAVMAA